MFDLKNNKKSNKVVVWVIVGILVACMVVPLFYNLILALAGNAG